MIETLCFLIILLYLAIAYTFKVIYIYCIGMVEILHDCILPPFLSPFYILYPFSNTMLAA